MDFRTASTRVTEACVTLADIARAAGASEGTMRQARLDPSNPGYRNAPASWEAAIAKLARERAGNLVKLAEELEG